MSTSKAKVKKELWQKAEKTLYALYGDMPDIRILNRFYSEKMIFGETDDIILWDLVAEIRLEAKHSGDLTNLSGTDSSCFVAYLMGASETNPLELHYFCPGCKRVEFINKRALPWDARDKSCECGHMMRADGFEIPYEMHMGKRAPWPHLAVAYPFMETAEKMVREKMRGVYRLCKLTKPDYAILRFAFLPFDENPDFEENVDSVDDKYDSYPQITVVAPLGYEGAKKLSEATGMDFDEVVAGISKRYLSDPRIIPEFRRRNVGGIVGFDWHRHPRVDELKEGFKAADIKDRYDLLKFLGTMHGTSNWWDNAEWLIKDGVCQIADIPSHRDDVFMMLRGKLMEAGHTCMGIAFDITRKVRLGIYERKGISACDRALLEYLDLPKWFVPYIEKIQYMSNKANSVGTLRIGLAFMWYKINYPKEFDACVESKLKDDI